MANGQEIESWPVLDGDAIRIDDAPTSNVQKPVQLPNNRVLVFGIQSLSLVFIANCLSMIWVELYRLNDVATKRDLENAIRNLQNVFTTAFLYLLIAVGCSILSNCLVAWFYRNARLMIEEKQVVKFRVPLFLCGLEWGLPIVNLYRLLVFRETNLASRHPEKPEWNQFPFDRNVELIAGICKVTTLFILLSLIFFFVATWFSIILAIVAMLFHLLFMWRLFIEMGIVKKNLESNSDN